MSQQPLIACALNASDYAARLAEMRELGRAALLDSTHDGRRARLRFAAGVGIRERVDAIVAAESRCCPFLTLAVADEPDTIVLTIEAPDGAQPVLDDLVGAFTAGPAA